MKKSILKNYRHLHCPKFFKSFQSVCLVIYLLCVVCVYRHTYVPYMYVEVRGQRSVLSFHHMGLWDQTLSGLVTSTFIP